jgi:hypothetical protein
MTDTTVTTAAPAAGTAATPVATINTFFAELSSDFQWLEEDVIAVIQNIGAGVDVAVNDVVSGLSWLGSHIGAISTGITAVQNSVTSLTALGLPIPPNLENGIAEINSAVSGVNDALNDTAVAANPSTALTAGYQAAKALQIAVASAAAISASIKAATAPAPAAAPATS